MTSNNLNDFGFEKLFDIDMGVSKLVPLCTL